MVLHERIRDVQKAASHSVAPLGYAVFWRFGGVQVLHTDLVGLLTQHGFTRYAPDPPTPTLALRRALLTWQRQLSGIPLLLRTITKTPLVLALVHEDTSQPTMAISYRTFLRVRYDQTCGDILCTRTPTGPIDAQTIDQGFTMTLRPLWQSACLTHTGEDLTRVVRAIITDLGAVRLQRGVYFVRASARPELQRLDACIDALPGSGNPLLVTLERIDDANTRRRLAHAIHEDFQQALLGMEDGIQQLFAVPQPTLGALTQYLLSFRALQDKATVYADLLSERYAEVTARLSALQARAQQLLLVDVDDLLGSPARTPEP